MLKRATIKGILAIFFASFFASCESFQSTKPRETPPMDQTTIRRVALPPDAVVFDALLVHIPYDDRALVNAFWEDVDEQEIDADVRRYLNEQGFRAGILGASPPASLSRLLTLKGRELRTSVEEEVDFSKKDVLRAPLAYSKPVNLRTGMKSLIEARDDVIPSIPILENQNGALVGKSYNDAQAVFSVAIEQVPDGSVRFDVTPFLRYGTPQLVTRYQHGQLVRTQEQPTKTFENLKCSLALRPGQFLAIGAADAKTNALGRYFFTDGGDDYDQKILILRLLVTQHDGQFDQFPNFKEIVRRENDKNGKNEPEVDLYLDVDGFEKATLDADGNLQTSNPAENDKKNRMDNGEGFDRSGALGDSGGLDSRDELNRLGGLEDLDDYKGADRSENSDYWEEKDESSSAMTSAGELEDKTNDEFDAVKPN